MHYRLTRLLVLVIAAVTLAGCGGGGGGGTSSTSSIPSTSTTTAPTSPTTALTGTVAKGAALAGATVTLVDATGKSISTTTAADGTYTLDVTGMTAPFIITATDGTNTLHSVALAAGVANVTPVTEVIAATYFQSQGTTLANAVSNPSGVTLPTAGSLGRVTRAVLTSMGPLMQRHGLDPSRFDPTTTAFHANHAGFDGVLDELQQTGPTTLTTVTGTVTTTISLQGLPGGTVNTHCHRHDSHSGADSDDDNSTSIGDGQSFPALDAAVLNVNTLLSNVTATINAKGASLAASDIAPYLTADFSDDGTTASDFATAFAAEFAGKTVQSLTVTYVVDFNGQAGLLNARYAVQLADGSAPYLKRMVFGRQADGSWLFRGNQTQVRASDIIRFKNQRTITNSGDSGFVPTAVIDAHLPLGLVTGMNALDPSGVFFNAGGTTVPKLAQATLVAGIPLDEFTLESSPNGASFPTATTQFSVALTLLGNTTVNLPVRAQATSTDTLGSYALTVNSQTPAQHNLAAVSNVPLGLTWTAPTTFTPVHTTVRVTRRSAGYSVDTFYPATQGGTQASVPALPATVQVPGQGSQSVTSLTVTVEAVGPAGELVTVEDTYQ